MSFKTNFFWLLRKRALNRFHINTPKLHISMNGCTYSKSISISREFPIQKPHTRISYTLAFHNRRTFAERLLLSSICRWTCANLAACAFKNVFVCVCVWFYRCLLERVPYIEIWNSFFIVLVWIKFLQKRARCLRVLYKILYTK